MNPFGFVKAFPEFNEVMNALFKKRSEILNYDNKLDLIEIRQKIKYMSHWMNSVSNNYDA